MKLSLRLKESRTRRKEKSRDSENSKRRLQIDRQKSMPSEQRELLKRESDRLESERDLSIRRDCA
jgi:hypothetical protein